MNFGEGTAKFLAVGRGGRAGEDAGNGERTTELNGPS